MMKLKTLTAAGVATVLAASAAQAQETLRFGHVGEPGSLFAMSAEHFAEVANEKLGGEYTVEVFGSSQLGNDQQLLQKLKLGQVTFSLPSSVMSSVAPEFGVFEMPYIIQNREQIRAVSRNMLEDTFQPAAQEQGYRILAFWENGFRHITNNVRPINVPEDLEGIKLRTPRGEWRVKMFQTYGANPTPMAFADVFTALETGVIDGQENPYAQIASANFQEVQDYLSITGHVYTPAYILTGEERFSNLPDDVQNKLKEAALETQDYVYETAAELADKLLEQMRSDLEVNKADKQAFIDASQPIYDEFAETVEGGGELIDRVMSYAPSN